MVRTIKIGFGAVHPGYSVLMPSIKQKISAAVKASGKTHVTVKLSRHEQGMFVPKRGKRPSRVEFSNLW